MPGPRILLVEDQHLVAAELASILASCGCRVTGPFADVAGALRAAREEPLDGAVLDVLVRDRPVVPVVDELLARGVPFLFVSGLDTEASLPEELRAFPSLRKPFRAAELRDAVTRHFQARGPGPDVQLPR